MKVSKNAINLREMMERLSGLEMRVERLEKKAYPRLIFDTLAAGQTVIDLPSGLKLTTPPRILKNDAEVFPGAGVSVADDGFKISLTFSVALQTTDIVTVDVEAR